MTAWNSAEAAVDPSPGIGPRYVPYPTFSLGRPRTAASLSDEGKPPPYLRRWRSSDDGGCEGSSGSTSYT